LGKVNLNNASGEHRIFPPSKVIDTHFALLQLLQVHLDYPTEYLTSVSGYTREDSCHVINSLTFHSNKRAHGPIGEEKGKFFSFPKVNGKIIGFHGRCGSFLDSIGAHFGPVSHPYPFEMVGPFGNGKNRWDDGKHADVRQIVVVSGSAIESVSFTYEEGPPFRHGTTHGGKRNTVHYSSRNSMFDKHYPLFSMILILPLLKMASG